MKRIWIMALASFVAITITAFVIYMEVSARAEPRSGATEFFDYERPPTHGGQQMQPRWGGN